MHGRTESEGPASADPVLAGLGRAAGGALIFCLPMLMTMEMWQLGFLADRFRLLLLIGLSLPLLLVLSHYSGFERTRGWREDFRDVLIALGLGITVSTLVLLVLAMIGPGMSPNEIIGKVAVQVLPAALGALLGRSQLGDDSVRESEDRASESYGGELVVMAVGALFLGLNVAPTDEIEMLAITMSPWHLLVLVGVSLLAMHGFVFATGFKGGSEIAPETPWWSAFLRFTLVGYGLALAISLYVLWTFGRIDGLGLDATIRAVVVLGFPAAIGAAAARLIL
ncbi:putative integral membrane protein TIGR02587 [Devosia enhydra]|uniref:Putative integral membrane protein TIGR02587 n=1 Tax=Devosia enhydra TaxID=665118 RepID=A0A1K2I301_9HYPH|nr:TIGR02587 family membrane protein [Devosia enhydra]SFZ86770.1 putative integral membrane protein TIGR02587 [Devosia enhydra]